MAAVDEIAIKLGIKTGDLKAALLDAGADVKKFKKEGESGPDEGLMGQLKGIKKGFKDFGDILAAGGIATAVQQFFALAIDRAEQLKGTTDANAAAVRGFASGVTEAKNVFADFAVLTIGTFNRLGSAIGDAANIMRSFAAHGKEGFEEWARVEDAIETTAIAADAAERRLAETRKKNGAEFEAISHELADIEKKSQEQKLKGLDIYETEKNINMHLIELRAQLRNSEGDAIEKRRIAVEIAKTQLSADEAALAVKKDQAAQEKAITEDMKKQWETAKKEADDLAKRRALDQKEELEIFTLQQKNAAELTKAERDRLSVLMLQRQEKSTQVAIEDLLQKKITDGLAPEEAKRLAELLKQSGELQKQIAAKQQLADVTENVQLPAEEDVTDEIAKQLALEEQKTQALKDFYSTSISQKGDVRELSDVQLAALKTKLNAQLEERKKADDVVGGFGGKYVSVEQSLVASNLRALEEEQRTRREFITTIKAFGEQYAERTFSPDEFNRLRQLINPDVVMKQAQDISSIQKTLATLFPKEAAGIRP